MYHAVGPQLSPAQCDALVRLSRQLDLAPGPGGTRMTDSALSRQVFLPWLREHLFHDERPVGTIQLIALYPSQQIVLHCDPPIPMTRHHLPIQINDGCWSLHDGEWEQLQLGMLYRMDPTEPHGAVNWGAELRLHLILDA